ncbi:radical SAM protein [Clostridiaceae bacterium M8S5]|nr:radical SAM protein [Clostridiaceae bacterium M8S5]
MKIERYGDKFLIRVRDQYLLTNEIAKNIILDLYETRNVKKTIEKIKVDYDLDDQTIIEWLEICNKPMSQFEEYEGERIKFPKPFKIQWRVTDKCNLACKHCYAMNETELGCIDDYDTVMKIVDKIIENNTMELSITGGEVSTLPMIREILEKLMKNNIFINIYTNGMLLDEHMEFLKEKKDLFKLFISVDGSREGHEKVRGEDTYDKLLKNISLAVSNGCIVQTSTVINALNYQGIPDMILELKEIGIKAMQFSYTVIEGNAVKNKEILEMTQDMYDNLTINMMNLMDKLDGGIRIFYDPYNHNNIQYENKNKSETPWECTAGETRFTIIESGDVLCCPFFPEFTIGNIAEEEIIDIWNKRNRIDFIDFRNVNSSSEKCAALMKGRVKTNVTFKV